MSRYRINPYTSFIESRLFPEFTQYAVFHRITGDLVEPNELVRSFLQKAKSGEGFSLSEADLASWGDMGREIKELVRREFLILEDYDPLTSLMDQYVARPIQNPALVYCSNPGEWTLVRTSMEHAIYSPKRDQLPKIIEEILPPIAAEIFLLSDGTKTLRQIFSSLRGTEGVNLSEDSEFRTAIDLLTSQERQLIKVTTQLDDLLNPFVPVNIVPRNLYHSNRWEREGSADAMEPIIDFHLHGIEDANWEFDLIEPTVNHCFRYPHEALGGLDYGSRFCTRTLTHDVLPLLDQRDELHVLEAGGGTGSFARSFIQQAKSLVAADVEYHILDLSPALMENQRKILSDLLPESRHFHQDATKFEIPDQVFDLIISNEVIADFPVASVQRIGDKSDQTFTGDGVYYLDKYQLPVTDAPESFLVNAGAFQFLEQAWKHLAPGGTLIVSEYGAEQRYPARSYHLNHDEFTIHFRHLAACAEKVGFQCRLLALKDFLSLDDDILVLNGREEHLLCLNHIFSRYEVTLPFAIISKSEFKLRCGKIADEIGLSGYSFSPLKTGYHFGPNIKDFFVLIMNKPQSPNAQTVEEM